MDELENLLPPDKQSNMVILELAIILYEKHLCITLNHGTGTYTSLFVEYVP